MATTRLTSSRLTGKVEARVWDAPPEQEAAASSPSHVVEAGNGVEVMAAADAASNGGTLTVAAVGEDVAAGANDQVRIHRDLRGVI